MKKTDPVTIQFPSLLYLVPSSLGDDAISSFIPTAARDAIEKSQVIFAENAKPARRFISSLNLSRAIQSYEIIELPQNLTIARATETLAQSRGQIASLVSDAGAPCVADPGSPIVLACHAHNVPVAPISGPSSILLALMSSGLNGQQFSFHGYLPIEEPARSHALKRLDRDAQSSGYTQIFIETPYRAKKLFEQMLQQLSTTTLLCVAAGVTLPSQKIATHSIQEWRTTIFDLGKDNAVFLIGKAPASK